VRTAGSVPRLVQRVAVASRASARGAHPGSRPAWENARWCLTTPPTVAAAEKSAPGDKAVSTAPANAPRVPRAAAARAWTRQPASPIAVPATRSACRVSFVRTAAANAFLASRSAARRASTPSRAARTAAAVGTPARAARCVGRAAARRTAETSRNVDKTAWTLPPAASIAASATRHARSGKPARTAGAPVSPGCGVATRRA
jgi:hypothetical protein